MTHIIHSQKLMKLHRQLSLRCLQQSVKVGLSFILYVINLPLHVADVSVSMEPPKEPTDAGSTSVYIIAGSLGATVLLILLLVIVPILLALICSKGIVMITCSFNSRLMLQIVLQKSCKLPIKWYQK